MNNTIKNNLFLTGLLAAVMLILLFDYQTGTFTLKAAVPAVIFLVGMWYEYIRGYNAGKAYYTEYNPELVAKASPEWDHQLSLREVLEKHPFCLMELDHAPCQEHDYPTPSGVIHLVQNEKNYTTLKLEDNGWVYACDTSIGHDVLKSGKYQPILTRDAMRIIQDSIWNLYF